jgi:hypothetical protein
MWLLRTKSGTVAGNAGSTSTTPAAFERRLAALIVPSLAGVCGDRRSVARRSLSRPTDALTMIASKMKGAAASPPPATATTISSSTGAGLTRGPQQTIIHDRP